MSHKRVLGTLITDKCISLVFDMVPYTIPAGTLNYDILKEKIQTGDYTDEDVEEYLTLRHMIKSRLKNFPGSSSLYVDSDKQEILYNKTIRLPVALEKKLFYGLDKGHSLVPFLAFIDNLMLNPSEDSRNELYLFLEAGNMPLTEDGCFLAYKKVRANYTDQHTGKMDNSVGAKPYMDRALCDANRNVVCSSGLHFCSWEYLNSMTGSRVMVLKVNPKDVVSIPRDYGDTKGRASTYEIIGEIKDWSEPVLEGKQVKEVEPILTVPDAPLSPLEVRANGGDTFISAISPYSWIKEGGKALLDGEIVFFVSNPFRKTKKPWMVEFKRSVLKENSVIEKTRCSALKEIK